MPFLCDFWAPRLAEQQVQLSQRFRVACACTGEPWQELVVDRLQGIPNIFVERDKLGCSLVTNHLHLSRRLQRFLHPFEHHPPELCTREVGRGEPADHGRCPAEDSGGLEIASDCGFHGCEGQAGNVIFVARERETHAGFTVALKL